MFQRSSIHRLSTSRPDLYAFNVSGTVTEKDMSRMAQVMQNAFKEHEEVDMLLNFDDYKGSDLGSGLSLASLDAQINALAAVRRYVVANAPKPTKWKTDFFDTVVPIRVESFKTKKDALQSLNASETA